MDGVWQCDGVKVLVREASQLASGGRYWLSSANLSIYVLLTSRKSSNAMISREFRLLIWVLCVHLAGIYLFTKGFLLTRLALPDRGVCTSDACTSLATHKRAVLLVIDALRFDFIAEHPPEPVSPFHHNILTLPRELTAAHPDRSFIFNAYSDPPTTTLQRLKGLTTGSLPTFVDAGENFGGS